MSPHMLQIKMKNAPPFCLEGIKRSMVSNFPMDQSLGRDELLLRECTEEGGLSDSHERQEGCSQADRERDHFNITSQSCQGPLTLYSFQIINLQHIKP